MILVALSVALAEEVAEKKTEKRWIYGSGYGGYNDGKYNSLYGNQAYNQYGTTNKTILFFAMEILCLLTFWQ